MNLACANVWAPNNPGTDKTSQQLGSYDQKYTFVKYVDIMKLKRLEGVNAIKTFIDVTTAPASGELYYLCCGFKNFVA